MKKWTSKALAIAGALALVLTPTGAAFADQSAADQSAADKVSADKSHPVPFTEPIADHLIIDGEKVAVTVMELPPSGPVEIIGAGPSQLAEVVSGEIVNGEVVTDNPVAAKSLTDVAPMAACSWKNWVAPAGGAYYQSVAGCYVIGASTSTQVGYNISINTSTVAGACGQALGYKLVPGSNGSYYYAGYWQALGCKNPGQLIQGTVNWGNVAASKRVLMASTGGIAGSSGQFL
ncbi:hypothetical protein [Homoserinimonas sp. A520]